MPSREGNGAVRPAVKVRALLRHETFLVAASLAAMLAGAGCVTEPVSSSVSKPVGRGLSDDETAARQELLEVVRLLEHEERSRAIPRLLQIMTKYPDTQASIDSEYYLARTYQEIASYREAIDLYNEYLRLAPDGKYAPQSHEALAVLVEKYERNFWTAERLNRQIAEVSQRLKTDPGNVQWQLDLADLYWKRGDYDRAGEVYTALVEAQPEYLDDATIRGRLEPVPSGGYTVITPAEVQRRAIERQPLSIINTSAFKSGEDLITRTPLYYVVTGMAVNRSDSVLYGVQVLVTIYGFGNVVYDTNTVTLGRLNPGETRAFSVRFFNFPSIHRIHRYEAVGTFER